MRVSGVFTSPVLAKLFKCLPHQECGPLLLILFSLYGLIKLELKMTEDQHAPPSRLRCPIATRKQFWQIIGAGGSDCEHEKARNQQ